jgi:anti-sigma28 factor (negative regulator of flagellin synthesis)
MVNFATTAAGAIPPVANEIANEVANEVVPNAPPADLEGKLRLQRIRQLREAIESGQYCVAASELADALLRAARRAN